MSLTDRPPQAHPPARRRSTRDRPAKAPLSEDAIVDAALAILKADGLEAVTMRRVAAALDTGAASLYVYVSGREGLLQAMVDRVIATIEVEAPDPSRWREQLRALVRRMRSALVAHPGIAAMFLTIPPMTETVLQLTENLMGILLAGGLEPQDAAWTSDILLLLSTAVATENDARRGHGKGDGEYRREVDGLRVTFAGLPPDRFPSLAAYAAEMVAGDLDERFDFAVDVVIAGVVARADRR